MTPKLTAQAISFTGFVGLALWNDFQGYARARGKYIDSCEAFERDPIGSPEPHPPRWDWPLFTSRMASAIIAGVLTALGISVST